MDCIASICNSENRGTECITVQEVKQALKKLKNNKAADTMGLTSEHLKFGCHPVESFLTDMLNHLVQSKKVSVALKEGIVTPIFKKR